MGFKLMAGAVASCALIGVAVGVGIIYGSLLISIGRNPSQRDELLRYAFTVTYIFIHLFHGKTKFKVVSNRRA